MGSRHKSIGKGILVVLGLWLAFVVAALVWSWSLPRTKIGWAAALVLGPVFFIASEVVGEILGKLFNMLPGIRHAREAVELRTRDQSFSGARVFTYLVTGLIPIVAVMIWVLSRENSSLPHLIRDWLHRHFL